MSDVGREKEKVAHDATKFRWRAKIRSIRPRYSTSARVQNEHKIIIYN